jgi:hypothetical protein
MSLEDEGIDLGNPATYGTVKGGVASYYYYTLNTWIGPGGTQQTSYITVTSSELLTAQQIIDTAQVIAVGTGKSGGAVGEIQTTITDAKRNPALGV